MANMMKKSAVALALAGLVSAQSEVISVFFPGADQQALVGSIVASDATETTIVLACPTDVDSLDCGFAEPVTVTAGPSTFHAEETFDAISVVLDCAVTGTTEATCAETYVGPGALIAENLTDDPYTNTDIITTTVTTSLEPSDIAWIPVTITAGADGHSNSTTTGSASTSGSTSTRPTGSSTTSSGSHTTSGGSGTSATPSVASASPNSANKAEYRTMGWSALGAGLMGLTLFWL